MVDPIRNPYAPGAGQRPPELAGRDEQPEMRATACTSGTYQVLKRIDGKTSGEKDAEAKCAKVAGYTKWYFYDSPLDDLDFVLCLKEHKAL